MTSSSNNLPVDLGEALLSTLRVVTIALQSRSIPYAIMGGLAVGMRGRLRTTKDVDVLMAPTQFQLPRLLEDLVDAGFPIDVRTAITRWTQDGLMPVDSGQSIRVDFMRSIVPAFEHVLHRASQEQFGDLSLSVVDVEGLLLLKLLAFRPQDQLDIRGLLAANIGDIDLDWVRSEWSQLSGLDPTRTAQFEALVDEFAKPNNE